MLFSHLLKHLLKNNDLIHQDNNLLLGVRLRSVHDRFYHFNLVCPLAVICTKCERGLPEFSRWAFCNGPAPLQTLVWVQIITFCLRGGIKVNLGGMKDDFITLLTPVL